MDFLAPRGTRVPQPPTIPGFPRLWKKIYKFYFILYFYIYFYIYFCLYFYIFLILH
jgi:hypothetical protein